MFLRIIIFLSIIFLPISSFAECNFNTSKYISELNNPKNIKFIEIVIPKSQRYVRNFLQTLSSSIEERIILPKFKKRFFAKINIDYLFGRCEFEGRIRQSGDWLDHIKVKDGNPFRSLDIRLKTGNILNAIRFKLLIPETRNNLNEILGSLILKELNFITPETFQVNTKINGAKNIMIFQEKSQKELLERNNKREGPIFEGDEELLWGFENFNIFELENVSLSKLLNDNWFSKGNNYQIITIKAFQKLQTAYLEYINYYMKSKTVLFPNFKENEIFLDYHLLLESMNGYHALRPHNRQYYYNIYLDSFEPIYYDGMFKLTKPIEKFNKNIYSKSQIKKIDEYLNILENKQIQKKLERKFNSRIIETDENFFSNSLVQVIENLKIAKKTILTSNTSFYEKTNNTKNRNHYFENHKKNNFNQFIVEDLVLKDTLYEVDISSIFSEKISSKRISSNDLAEVLSGNKLEDKRTVFLPKKEVLKIFNNQDLKLKRKKLNDGQIIHSKDLQLKIFDKEKKIEIIQKFSNDWILFSNMDLSEWNISFYGEPTKSKDGLKQTINNYGMTGCLNFHKIKFNDTILNLEEGECEDTINIVNSIGRIKFIKVKSAYSDALDIDFSEIKIDHGIIDNAGNDCVDFSGGKYSINKFELSNCGDKAISIGEKSVLNLSKVNIENSKMGIASKDSSISKINSANMENVEICLTAYNKKQEFYGGLIALSDIKCKNFSTKKKEDKQSNIIVNKWN